MNDAWKAFLLRNGAVFDNDALLHFGNPDAARVTLPAGNLLVDLSTQSLVRVHGAEASAFLNGQFTNDITLLSPTQSQLSAWCNAQGRMLAVMRLFIRDEAIHLQLPRSLRDETVKRLRMFVLRAKVVLDNVEDLVTFGVVGPDAASHLQQTLGALPDADDGSLTTGPITVIRERGIQPRYRIIAPVPDAQALWSTLAQNSTPASAIAWEWHDIQAGIPTVLPPTVDSFVPQMANLERINGVNFKKGCYPGQEIVARVQYLGRLKQRMYRAHLAAPVPAPGTALYTTGNEQSVGTIVNASPSPKGGSDTLVVIQIAVAEQGDIHLGAVDGPALRLETLPYSL